jgi:hypothetical protein
MGEAYKARDTGLDEKEGPYRIVIPDEKRMARWVRQVTALKIVNAGPSAVSGIVAIPLSGPEEPKSQGRAVPEAVPLSDQGFFPVERTHILIVASPDTAHKLARIVYHLLVGSFASDSNGNFKTCHAPVTPLWTRCVRSWDWTTRCKSRGELRNFASDGADLRP